MYKFLSISSFLGLNFIPIPIFASNLNVINNFYNGNSFFGLMGYQNLKNRVFDDHVLNRFAINSLDIIFIGILCKSAQNKKSNQLISNNDNLDFINLNILYFLVNLRMNSNIKGITNFSDLKQYENFQYRVKYLEELLSNNSSIMRNIKNNDEETNHYKNYDHYGGHFSLKNYFVQPKLILFKIKYVILSFLKARKFSNNFFG